VPPYHTHPHIITNLTANIIMAAAKKNSGSPAPQQQSQQQAQQQPSQGQKRKQQKQKKQSSSSSHLTSLALLLLPLVPAAYLQRDTLTKILPTSLTTLYTTATSSLSSSSPSGPVTNAQLAAQYASACPDHRPRTHIFSTDPLIIYVEDYLTKPEIAYLLDLAVPYYIRSPVSKGY